MEQRAIGLISNSGKWKKMCDARRSLEAAGVPLPKEIQDYFRDKNVLDSVASKEHFEGSVAFVDLEAAYKYSYTHGGFLFLRLSDIPDGVDFLAVMLDPDYYSQLG